MHLVEQKTDLLCNVDSRRNSEGTLVLRMMFPMLIGYLGEDESMTFGIWYLVFGIWYLVFGIISHNT